jgi:hypothetical protein
MEKTCTEYENTQVLSFIYGFQNDWDCNTLLVPEVPFFGGHFVGFSFIFPFVEQARWSI